MAEYQQLQITSETILRAYQLGLFPMGESCEDSTIYWVDPERRGIIPLSSFHVPRSVQRTLRRVPFVISIDKSFYQVVHACARRTPRRPNTWINRQIIELYMELFEKGQAHSIECWSNGVLVGGLYGVTIGAAFFGESMFSTVRDSSKVALVHLVERLRFGGFRLLDTQFVTDHLRRFGAIEIDRDEYLQMLAVALSEEANFYSFDTVDGSGSIVTGGGPVEPIGE